MITLQWTVGMDCYVYDQDVDKIYYGTIICLSGIYVGNRTATIQLDDFTRITLPETALCQKAWQARNQRNIHNLIANSKVESLNDLLLFLNDMLQDPTTHISDKNFEKLAEILENMEKTTK